MEESMAATKNHKPYHYTKKTGRPILKKEDILPEDWKEEIKRLSAEGASKHEIYLHFYRKNPRYFDKLCERDEEFSAVIKKSLWLCQGWWEEQGRKHLRSPGFQSALWYMNMKNRFGWRDKTDIEHNLGEGLIEKFANLSSQQLIQKANELIGRKNT
jgi:hypothetical protein